MTDERDRHRHQLEKLVEERTEELAAEVVQRRDAEKALQHRVIELSCIQSLARQVSTTLSPRQAAQAAVDEVTSVFSPDLALLFLRQEDDLVLQATAPEGGRYVHLETPVHRVGECMCGLAVSEGNPLYAENIHTDPRCTWDECKRVGLHSLAALPLRVGDTVIGVLALGSASETTFEDRADFLETVADQVAIGMQNALLHREMLRRAEGLEETVAQRTLELQAERDRTQAILEAVGESVVVTDPEDRVLYVNPATGVLTGFSNSLLLGQSMRQWWSERSGPGLDDEMRRTVRLGKTWHGEMEGRRKDGTPYDAAVTVAPILDPDDDDRFIGSVWVVRDITPLKETERLKDQFVSNVSHELRTPLSVLTLASDNLIAFYDRLGERARLKHIAEIRDYALLLNELIGDVLEISRIDGGRVSTERTLVELGQLLQAEVEEQQPLAEERSQTLRVLELDPQQVLANPGQIRRVIRNLLSNAIKYSADRGEILCECQVLAGDVALEATQPGGSAISTGALPGARYAAVRVTDNGSGITAQELPRIFERFYRVHTEGARRGTGLGLSIAQELVELHSGCIVVSSAPGRGSTFTVCLPLPEEES
jgi:PAS domain S-box-containing protein